jgi:hypothetical protein
MTKELKGVEKRKARVIRIVPSEYRHEGKKGVG